MKIGQNLVTTYSVTITPTHFLNNELYNFTQENKSYKKIHLPFINFFSKKTLMLQEIAESYQKFIDLLTIIFGS